MPRLTFHLACVFGQAALMAGSAHAEYDSGGTPTNPAQIQANRPQTRNGQISDPQDLQKSIQAIELTQTLAPEAVLALDPADARELLKLIQAIKALQPIAPKPVPAKKPLPKPRGNLGPSKSKISSGMAISADGRAESTTGSDQPATRMTFG
jgi:hypothetical protein